MADHDEPLEPKPFTFDMGEEPPRRGRAKAGKAAPKTPTYRNEMFVEPLTALYAGIGVMVSARDLHCGPVIIESAEQAARSLDTLAKTNPAVRRALHKLMESSQLSAVLMAHAPIILAVISHHTPVLPGPGPEEGAESDVRAA